MSNQETGVEARGRRILRSRGDRGDATIETVIVVPVLVFLIMGIVQFGMWMHASHIADAAARDGVSAARLEGAGPGATGDAARETLDRLANGLITNPSVDAQQSAERVTVRVSGTVRPIIPGVAFTVTRFADGPVERFRSDA